VTATRRRSRIGTVTNKYKTGGWIDYRVAGYAFSAAVAVLWFGPVGGAIVGAAVGYFVMQKYRSSSDSEAIEP
jgi:hypothetical protein